MTRLSESTQKLLVFLLLVAGALVRLWAATDDFWFDEIWSLGFARELKSAGGVFTAIHHDNNHWLNTLWLYLLGEQRDWLWYRVPAVVFGIATLVLTAAAAASKNGDKVPDWTTAGVALLITSFSPFLVTYQSEARGYSGAMFCALSAYICFVRYLQAPGRKLAAVIGAISCVGILSHLTYLFVFAALLGASGFQFLMERWRDKIQQAAAMQGNQSLWVFGYLPPFFLLIVLWAVDLRRMVYGGGPVLPWMYVVLQWFRYVTGAPGGIAGAAVIGAIIAAGVCQIMCVSRGAAEAPVGRARGSLLVLFLLFVPLVAMVFHPHPVRYPRYFAVQAPVLLLLVAQWITQKLRQGGLWRWPAALLLVVVLAGQLWRLVPLLRDGRGHYSEAVAMMSQETRGDVFRVASDNDQQAAMLLKFYAPRIAPGRRFELISADQNTSSPQAIDWVIRNHFNDSKESAPAEIQDRAGQVYRLRNVYPSYGLSGWSWELYRRL